MVRGRGGATNAPRPDILLTRNGRMTLGTPANTR
jgi:hypothetical protein